MDDNKADSAQITRIDQSSPVSEPGPAKVDPQLDGQKTGSGAASPISPPSHPAPVAIAPSSKPQAVIAVTPNPGKEQLYVGPGLKLKLEVGQCDIFRCEGEAEGNVKAKQLILSPSGRLAGHIEVDTAEVEGSFDGIMIVAGFLHVRSTGRISGNVRYKQIEIERGGQVQGQMSAMDANIPAIVPAVNRGSTAVTEPSAGENISSGTPAIAEAKKVRKGIFG